MKVIIAGGRDYRFQVDDYRVLDQLNKEMCITEVVSGGAKGADEGGELWAVANGLPVTVFRADWDQHGRAAGPIRNKLMALYAHGLVAFPGGKGTDHMIEVAKERGLDIIQVKATA